MQKEPTQVLCFGDSNTWGHNPASQDRYPASVRWPGVLQRELGEEFSIIEEGLGGRTCVFEDPIEGNKSGLLQLPPLLHSHSPIGIMIIMLGTNDMKRRFGINAFEAARGLGRLIQIVRSYSYPGGYQPPEIILAAPPPILENPRFAEMFNQQSIENSRHFAEAYSAAAEEQGCRFVDAGEIIVSDPADGIHLSAESHDILGKRFAEEILAMIKT